MIRKKFNGQIENRNLQWTDFVGRAQKKLNYDAYTLWNINYRYEEPLYRQDTVILNIAVWRELSRKSWYRKKGNRATSELLNHEQGHYDIAKLCELKLKDMFDNHVFFKSNYRIEIDSLFNFNLEKFKKLEKQYDKETHHMYNREEQTKWDRYFELQLNGNK